MINGCLRPVYIELTQYWTCCCFCCCGCSSCCCCCCCCSSVASGHVKWTDIKMTKTQINSKQMAKKEEQKSIGRQRAKARERSRENREKRIHRRFLLKRWMDLCFCLGLFYFVFFWFLVAGRIELGGFLLVCSTSRPSLDLFCCFPLLCFPFVPSLLRKGLSYAGCNWVTFLGSKKGSTEFVLMRSRGGHVSMSIGIFSWARTFATFFFLKQQSLILS